jgi:hypothetical protein
MPRDQLADELHPIKEDYESPEGVAVGICYPARLVIAGQLMVNGHERRAV